MRSSLACLFTMLSLVGGCGRSTSEPAAAATSATPSAAPAAMATATTAAPAAAVPARWAIAPLTITNLGTSGGFTTYELAADGASKRDGKPDALKYFADHVQDTKDGSIAAAWGADGFVNGSGGKGYAIDAAAGTLTSRHGEVLTLKDDGTFTFKRKTGETVPGTAKVTGLTPATKAIALVMYTFTGSGVFLWET